MAVNMLNKSWQAYVSDDGNTYNILAQTGGPLGAVDGHTTDLTKPKWGPVSKSHRPRSATFYDPATFRTVKGPIYTAAAFAAIISTTTVSVGVVGSATAVTYSLLGKDGEVNKPARTSRNLAE